MSYIETDSKIEHAMSRNQAAEATTESTCEGVVIGATGLCAAKSNSLVQLAEIRAHNPKENQLLGALPAIDYQRLLPDLSLINMQPGMTLSDFARPAEYVYFPTSSIVSLLHESEDGSCAEIAIIGKDGMAGVGACMGGESKLIRTVVSNAGFGFRLPKQKLIDEFERGGALQQLLLHYAQALMTQMSQMAVCNRHHSVPQQLCRRLLLSLDGSPAKELDLTQEAIAHMLGVRRESVVAAAGRLQQEGLIQYSRGHITVIDRAGMEARVCECYACIKDEYNRLLRCSRSNHADDADGELCQNPSRLKRSVRPRNVELTAVTRPHAASGVANYTTI